MKSVGIADLKARLSHHLRQVRRGHALVVLDRTTPIARLIPYEAGEPLKVRRPAEGSPPLQRVQFPPPLDLGFDVVDLLLDERQLER